MVTRLELALASVLFLVLSQVSIVPGVDAQGTDPKYITLTFVHDSSRLEDVGGSQAQEEGYEWLELAQAKFDDAGFSPPVVLVLTEQLVHFNNDPYSTEGFNIAILNEFSEWAWERDGVDPLYTDMAIGFASRLTNGGTPIHGVARPDAFCQTNDRARAAAYVTATDDLDYMANVLARMIGIGFGFLQDDTDGCADGSLMQSGDVDLSQPLEFPTCNLDFWKLWLENEYGENGITRCLDTVEAYCGDGFVTEGEEDCDCLPNDPCDCCSSCQFLTPDIVCRAQSSVCDREVTCTGSSPTCPPRDLLNDGDFCVLPEFPTKAGVCFGGECQNQYSQCAELGRSVNVCSTSEYACGGSLYCDTTAGVAPTCGDTGQIVPDGSPCDYNSQFPRGMCDGGRCVLLDTLAPEREVPFSDEPMGSCETYEFLDDNVCYDLVYYKFFVHWNETQAEIADYVDSKSAQIEELDSLSDQCYDLAYEFLCLWAYSPCNEVPRGQPYRPCRDFCADVAACPGLMDILDVSCDDVDWNGLPYFPEDTLEYSTNTEVSLDCYTPASSFLVDPDLEFPGDDDSDGGDGGIDLIYYILLGLALVMILLVAAAWKSSPKGSPTVIVLLFVSLGDTASDIFFAYSLNDTGNRTLALISGAFIAGPMLVSMVVILGFVRRRLRDSSYFEWFSEHVVVASLISLTAITNLDLLSLQASRLFSLDVFSAPWSPEVRWRVGTLSLITTVMEDIPQLALQIIAASSTEGMGTAVAIAMGFTVSGIVFALFRKSAMWLLVSEHKRRRNNEPEISWKSDDEFGQGGSKMELAAVGIGGSAAATAGALLS